MWCRSAAPNWLLIHGANDDLVPVDQSRALASELKRKGIHAEYLEIPGEGHGLRSPVAQKTGMQAILKFFQKVL